MPYKSDVTVQDGQWVELTDGDALNFTVQSKSQEIAITCTDGSEPTVRDGIRVPKYGLITNQSIEELFPGEGFTRVFAKGVSTTASVFFSYV